MGKNKIFLEEHLPHISRVLVGSLDDLGGNDVVVIGHPVTSSQLAAWLIAGKVVIDLVGIENKGPVSNYIGIAW